MKNSNEYNLNLEQLYRGYILSFQSLGVQVYKSARNRPLFTHQVISYWAKVGFALGFYPWCEDMRKDLGWYMHDDKCVLHLESENDHKDIIETLKALNKSDAMYRIGVLFKNEKYNEDKWSKQLTKLLKKEKKTLVITTWWKQEEAKDSAYHYLVTGHTVISGRVKSLQKACCVWPKFGTLGIIFPKEPNYDK